jgi:uncharacterized oxidoreductase
MELASNTVLITGGASGIGLALAERFLQAGSEVIVCGRREHKLQEAKEQWPQLHTCVCDLAQESNRSSLFHWAINEFPRLNVLVNNAGIQRRLDLAQSAQAEAWEQTRQEIAINFEAPVHLAMLFIPHLRQQPRPTLINVTSGLSFSPFARVPIYSATKAALHSFTLSLRYQLSTTPIEVIEIIPPAVDTDLGGVGLHTSGVPLDEFADAIMARLGKGDLEIPYGTAERASRASRAELDEIFKWVNQPAT